MAELMVDITSYDRNIMSTFHNDLQFLNKLVLCKSRLSGEKTSRSIKISKAGDNKLIKQAKHTCEISNHNP